ncbi:FAD-dependent monooxygenase [Streptomyces sp. MK5]|uniref:FAD-dependent monooxygenase n=1 Tax=Streptomyces sp. MK5 TaxID=3064253 RepID=UPI002741E1C0|nr:FAD-dependent monooxygenase [Streptomyces sp. MK5]
MVDEGAGSKAIETEVVVVGGGPTGLMLACELAQAGVDTLVLEQLTRRVEQVKGGGIQPRTAELLEMRGLLEPLEKRAPARGTVGGHFATLPVPLDCSPWNTRHPCPIGLPQWEIEEVLEERATALGARMLRGAAVTALAQDADGVTAETADGRRVRAGWLVACDGGHSTVRRLVGASFPGRPGTRPGVLADVRLSSVSDLVPREIGHMSTMTRQAGGYWAMTVPMRAGWYRFTFGPVGEGAVDRDTPVSREEIATALEALYRPETVLAEVNNSSRFTDATRQVEQYRQGRVLFAGDAAHIHPPLGGQGLNLGIQDAFNLGWKLAAAVQGRAPEGLLDSYHTERHPVAAQVLHHTSAQRVLADPNPSEDVAALRDIVVDLLRLPDTNRHLAGLVSGLALAYPPAGDAGDSGSSGSHPLTGQRVPDVELINADGDRPVRLSALFREGNSVLLDLAGDLPQGLPLPERVDAVRAGYALGAEPLGADVLLIRPDGYVCWTATGPAAPDALLAAIARHLVRPGTAWRSFSPDVSSWD